MVTGLHDNTAGLDWFRGDVEKVKWFRGGGVGVKFGKVLGSVVCTRKDVNLEGIKLLVIQPLTRELEPRGNTYIAADAVGQAGVGQIVTVVFSADATQAFPQERIPVDASIVGLLDEHTVADLAKGGASYL